MPSVAEQAFDTRNRGALERFTHYGQAGEPGNGQFVSLWLLVDDGVITAASYQTHGCMWAMACGNATVTLIKGRSIDKALLLEPRDLDLVLGGIVDGKGDCADRTITALRCALGK